jgi:Ca-activated chloride channel family protein
MFRAPGSTLLFLAVASCTAQIRTAIEPRARPEVKTIPATFRLDARMVQIPVTVTDIHDRPKMDLHQTDFRIFEDGIEQQVAAFNMADGPISSGLVFDTSGSMKSRIRDSREAVAQLFQTVGDQDEFFLVRFSDRPEMVMPFTHDPGEISRRLGMVVPHGWTALYDAIFYSMQEMKRAANPRKALLVLSDGEDNNSRYSESEALSLIREGDVRVYAIGLFRQTHCLERMAAESGGRMIWVHKLSELPDAIHKLALEMRNVYVLSYFSKNPPAGGKYRKVKVDVQPPGLRVSWRRGYFEPGQ